MARLVAFAAAAWSLAGCATILAPGPDVVVIDSVPRGASVTVDGNYVGETPATVVLQRSQEAVIQMQLPGYRPVLYNLDKEMNPATLGNILLGGLIGIIVDTASHNIGKYGAGPVTFELHPQPGEYERLPMPVDEPRRRKRNPCPAPDPELEKLRPPGYVSPEEEDCIPVS